MSTASQRAQAASIGSLTRWAKEPDRKAATRPARRGFDARFEREVDPDGVLDPAERAIRAEMLKKAHMRRLALASAKSRKAKSSGRVPRAGRPVTGRATAPGRAAGSEAPVEDPAAP